MPIEFKMVIGGGIIIACNLIIEYLKLRKNNGCNGNKHCGDHYKLISHISEVRTDVKWLRENIGKEEK